MKRFGVVLVLICVVDARAQKLASMNLKKNRIAQFRFLSNSELLVYGGESSFSWLPFGKVKNSVRIDHMGYFAIPKQGSSFIARGRKKEQGFLIYDKTTLKVTKTIVSLHAPFLEKTRAAD